MKRIKNKLRYAAVFLAAAVMLSCVSLGASAAKKVSSKYYIQIYRVSANIREDASLDSRVIATAKGGTKLGYYGYKPEPDGGVWYKVRVNDTLDGWVSGQVGKKVPKEKAVLPENAPVNEQVADYIMRISDKYDAVGMQVAVIRGSDGKSFSWKWGDATKETDKMTSDTKIRVASISKVATAICAVSMQENGIVSINRNIGKYWGYKLPVANSLATLLNHTSTLRYLEIKPTREETLRQLITKQNYMKGTPGKAKSWMYNNYASGVAGATLELAGSCILDDYAKENIFEPLGINASFFSGTFSEDEKLATLYEENGTIERSVEIARGILPSDIPGNNSWEYMSGLTMTARDLAKLFSMLANDGEYKGTRVLSPESVEAMEKKYFTASENGGKFKQCLALRYRKNLYNASELYYHTGNAYGVLALASYNPETRDTVVVISIGGSSVRDEQGIYRICSSITSKIYGCIEEL